MHYTRLRIATALMLTSFLLPATASAGGRPRASSHPHWQVLLTNPAVTTPTGLAIDQRGNPKQAKWAYVADAATQRIIKFGTGGKILDSWQYGAPTNSASTATVAVGGSGNVFVADPATGAVSKFSPNGTLLASWNGFQQPHGIAVDSSGNVFVAESGPRTVTLLSPAGTVLKRFLPEKLFPPGGPGTPNGVAIGPPGYLYTSSTCVIGTTCGVGSDVAPHGDLIDGLYEIISQGPRQGYLMEIWFGLGYLPSGASQQPPYKEAEPFAGIDAITSDRKGNLYVAGTLWPLGGTPARGVLAYSPYGYKWARWNLPSQSPVHGIAVDPHGTVYVSQGKEVLKLVK